MHKQLPSALCCVVACSLAGTVLVHCNPAPPRTLVVRAGRLIDGTGSAAQPNMRVTIENGTIVALEADGAAPLPAEAQVIDARALTVLPGLIDTHVHTLGSAACTPGVDAGLRQTVRNLHGWLQAGVTTVSDLGGPTTVTLGVRNHAGTGQHRGPRVLVCGHALSAPGGYPMFPGDPNGASDMGLIKPVGDPEAARQAVRELAEAGVDSIKVMVQEMNFDGSPLPALDEPTVCALVAEAHRQELRVFAHAITNLGYSRALTCGVDVLAHGAGEALSPQVQTALLEKGIPVVPTHWAFEAPLRGPEHMERLQEPAAVQGIMDGARQDLTAYAQAMQQSSEDLPASLMPHVKKARAVVDSAARLQNTHWLHEHHVALALGTDSPFCFNWAGDPVWELQRFINAGLTPLEALSAATLGSARALNLHDALGRLTRGYRADLIAVAGHPDEDIAALRAVRHVVIDGVEQHCEAAWYEPLLLGWEILRSWLRA